MMVVGVVVPMLVVSETLEGVTDWLTAMYVDKLSVSIDSELL